MKITGSKKVKTFFYSCGDWGTEVFIVVRSPFTKQARAKIVRLCADFEKPLKNWVGVILNTESEKQILETHKLDTLYHA